jgi:4-hydroxy-tetrahydrodipicolinate reductase
MQSVGVGLTAEAFIESRVRKAGPTNSMYKTIPQHVLTGLGYTVTKVTEKLEPVLFDHPIYCRLLDKELPAGTCVGTRIVTESHTAEGVTADAHIELRLFRDGEIEHMRWEADGMPHTRVRTEREDSSHYTCSSLFNRIPDVIAAAPGIQELFKLGPLRHTALA